MRYIDCDLCGSKGIPLNNIVKVDEKVYCSNCLENHFADQKLLKNRHIEKGIDPTICSSCMKDFGDIELNKISTYPFCKDCDVAIKNKAFPVWVKAFFIGILIIVVFSFAWNWKYYRAYQDIQKANKSVEQGDFANASLLMNSASIDVPEVEDLRTFASYFKGIELLQKDKGNEALAELEKCRSKVPPDYPLENLIIQARIGASFDNNDYDGFLKAAKEKLALDTTQAVSLTSVASAYACLYAKKGREGYKASALEYLQRAKEIDSTSSDMKQYYNMIDYRIDTRKIIRREEFVKQFPNGWTKN
jgi:hypothetical protein